MGVTPRVAPRADAVVRGIGFMLASAALFAVADATVKVLTARYGLFQIMFFRSLCALLPLGAVAAYSGGLDALRTHRPVAQAVRAASGLTFIFCFFYAFKHLALADAYAITFAAPLFVTGLSAALLAEPVGRRRWMAVAVGFAGVVVMLRPGSGLVSTAGFVCLGGAFLYACSIVMVRWLSRTETNASLVFYLTVSGAAVAAVLMVPEWVTPGPFDLALLIAVGVVGGTAQLVITEAFRSATPSVVVPFEYTALLWAVVLGYALFGDLPSVATQVGGAIVVGSGLYLLHREAKQSRAARAGLARPA